MANKILTICIPIIESDRASEVSKLMFDLIECCNDNGFAVESAQFDGIDIFLHNKGLGKEVLEKALSTEGQND